jgi:hypothetical protein
MEFHVFPLIKKKTDAWDYLLDLNEGASAPWITDAPGEEHSLYVCCLVLTAEPKRKKPEGENQVAEMLFKDEPWGAYYGRIAIIVPVAVQSGIAMALGIKRLYTTCPCEHLKRLGITLLARACQHFEIEYLFLSPIKAFKHHIQRELNTRGVPFVNAGYRSLCWAFQETEDHSPRDTVSWFSIGPTVVYYTRKNKFRYKDAVEIIIQPPDAEYTIECLPPKRRVLLLNEGFYYSQLDDIDPDYRPPPLLPLETHDFLWFIAGDGVLVVHGPSLAVMAA